MNTRGAALRLINRLHTIENGRSLETYGLTVIDADSKMQRRPKVNASTHHSARSEVPGPANARTEERSESRPLNTTVPRPRQEKSPS